MALIVLVDLGIGDFVSEDDGETAWNATDLKFGFAKLRFAASVLVDGYSGSTKAVVTRDDFQLTPNFAERLAIAVYRSCGPDPLEASDMAMCWADLEWIIRRIAYYSEAQSALRKIRHALAGARTVSAT